MTPEIKEPRPYPTPSHSEPTNTHRLSESTKDQLRKEFENHHVASGNGKRSSTELSASSAYTPSKRSRQKSTSIGSSWTEGTFAQRPYAIENSDSEGDQASPRCKLFPAVANQSNHSQRQLDTGNDSHTKRDSPTPSRSLSPAEAAGVFAQPATGFAERASLEATRHSVDVQVDLDSGSDDIHSGSPRFQKKHQDSKSMMSVANKVWDIMSKKAFDPSSVQDNDYGYIYIFTNAAYPGYVKIGRTTNGPDQRKQEWSALCNSELDLVDQESQSFIAVPFHKRLETLIKNILWNEHYHVECVSCTNRRSDGRTIKHCEFFKIGKNEALLRVEALRNWARLMPYDENGLLKEPWKNKINRWRRNGRSKKILEKEDDEGLRFESFLKESSWLSSIEEWFYEPRLEAEGKRCPSRYVSLRTHWKSLFVFCVLHYVGSWIIAWFGARYIGALFTVASTLFAV
ncbi:MAG: hypothetical protein Q9191_001621 [Dirinaria sp. TL-2023a]